MQAYIRKKKSLKKLVAFFQIIRWQNLLFIVLTQYLMHYCVIKPVLATADLQPQITQHFFYLIVAASVCIAAAGNIINDYFDVNIDRINKPHKLIVGTLISRRWVIFWHLLLSIIGVYCSIYVSFKLNFFWISIVNCICVLLLFIYSASLKKKFLIGNIVVSVLTAWVIMILILPEFQTLVSSAVQPVDIYYKLLRIGLLYASFSFIISVVREVIKDMEDIDGDRKNNCKTMPIVWGINASKIFVFIWIIVLTAMLVVAQLYVVKFGWWISIIYSVLFIIIPLILVFKKLIAAQLSKHFNRLSKWVKYIMLAGILSMVFFRVMKNIG